MSKGVHALILMVIFGGVSMSFFYTRLLQVKQAVVDKQGGHHFAIGGSEGMPPKKYLKFRISEMQFPAFRALKRELFMIIFIEQ